MMIERRDTPQRTVAAQQRKELYDEPNQRMDEWMTGALVGGIIGLFFSLPGIILGPFLGAMLFEMLGDKEFKQAARAGAGATVGLLLGIAGKFSIGVVMIGLFATNVILRATP